MKHTKMITKALTAIMISAAMALTGCSTDISIKAKADKSADLTLKMDLGTTITGTLKALFGTADASQILPTADIKKSLTTKDFSKVLVAYTGTNQLALSGTLAAPEKQLTVTGDSGIKIANFVTCTSSSLTLLLSPDTIQELQADLPEDAGYVLDLFMAPVLTGEEMTTTEYKELIASVYGDELAKELAAAKINIRLYPPEGKKVKKAVTPSGSSDFSIPLIDFLTLRTTKLYSISW